MYYRRVYLGLKVNDHITEFYVVHVYLCIEKNYTKYLVVSGGAHFLN